MKTHKQKNRSVASYNRQVTKCGKANCNILYIPMTRNIIKIRIYI